MGFSVQLVLLRGSPPDAALEKWASRAMVRLETVRFPLLVAAGRIDEDAAPFTMVFLARLSAGVEVAPLDATTSNVELPAFAADAMGDEVDPFLLTIALLAKAEGVDAVFFTDSSISESGALVVPGRPTLRWDEHSADEGRDRAEEEVRKLFGADAPDLEELTWLGPRPAHWQRRLPVAARPSAGGLFRRVKSQR